MFLQEPYRPRPIRFLELWSVTDWRLKLYGIAYQHDLPRPELIEAAKNVALGRLLEIPDTLNHYRVGFVGIHDGRDANFAFVDFWVNENELHHHVMCHPPTGRVN